MGTRALVRILLVASLAACSAAAPEPTSRPNVVVILADDLGYGDVACYWPESKVPTPRLDGLAAEGLRFTDAHSPSSVCSPTRYGLLVGHYAWRTWLTRSVLWAYDPPLLDEGRPTLASVLRDEGYATACVGKWHLGWEWPIVAGGPAQHGGGTTNLGVEVDWSQPVAGGPLARGFDHYFGDDVPNFPPYTFLRDDRIVAAPTETKPDTMFGTRGAMAPGWELDAVMPAITERACGWIEERAPEGPFFLYFSLTAPHTPIVPAAGYVGASEAGAYGDFVHQVDASVGAVLDALEAAGVADDTLVVFTSDNGSPARNGTNASGPVGSVERDFGHDPSGPWRGLKADLWEGGHRVPFLVRWPGVVPAGEETSALSCHVDLFATIAALLDLELPDGAAPDSVDLSATWRGDPDAPSRGGVVHHSSRGVFAFRRGRWKLLEGQGSGGWTQPTGAQPIEDAPPGQLYDLVADPGETRNLWNAEPEVVANLAAALDAVRGDG